MNEKSCKECIYVDINVCMENIVRIFPYRDSVQNVRDINYCTCSILVQGFNDKS